MHGRLHTHRGVKRGELVGLIASDNPSESLFIRVAVSNELQFSFVHVLYFAHLIAAWFYNTYCCVLVQAKIDNISLAEVRVGESLQGVFQQAGGLRYQLLVLATLFSSQFGQMFELTEFSAAIETYGNKRNTARVVPEGCFFNSVDTMLSNTQSVVYKLARLAEKVPSLLPCVTPTVHIGLGVTTTAKDAKKELLLYCHYEQDAPFMRQVSDGQSFYTAAPNTVRKLKGELYTFKDGIRHAVYDQCRGRFMTFSSWGLPVSFHGALSKSIEGRHQTYCVWARKIQPPPLQVILTKSFKGAYIVNNVSLNESVEKYRKILKKYLRNLEEVPNGGRYEHTAISVYRKGAEWGMRHWLSKAIEKG